MTVASTTNRRTFAGDGTSTVFSFPYYFMGATDLIVTTTDALGNILTKILNSDYTVSGTAGSNGTYPNGGSVTFTTAPAAGLTVSIIRAPAATQSSHWVDNDPDSALVKETAFDRAALLVQRCLDLLSRSVGLPDGALIGSFNPQLPALALPNALLGTDATGTKLVWTLGPAFRAGPSSIGQGVTSVVVVFSSPLPNTNYTVPACLSNTVDGAPDFQPVTVTGKTINGFTASWNDPTPTSNYKLEWSAIGTL